MHNALLDAAHAQPAAVVTETLPLDAPEATDAEVGLIENAQPEAWVIVNVWLAMMSVALRDGPLLAVTA